MKQRYFIQLSYNGSAHSGWQRQNNAPTIQQSIEEAIGTILRIRDIRIAGCGRTDTGVHAKQYFAHVDLDIPDNLDLLYRLNQLLEKEIAIKELIPVASDAHARFDAISRSYQYKIHFHKDPFKVLDSALVKNTPDMILMNQAAKHLIGKMDFTSFAKVENDANHHFCNLTHAQWRELDGGMVFDISANRFLRNMVRTIVGTLLEVGYGKRTIQEFADLIIMKDRIRAGKSVEAVGLSLVNVEYNIEL